MKRFGSILSIMLLGVFGVMTSVHAEDVYYTNEKGVSFTEKEYNFFGEMYYDGFQKVMDQEIFDRYTPDMMDISKIKKNSYLMDINPIGDLVQTSAKRLTIAQASGSNFASVVVTLKWLGSPNMRSYDVMGAYFSGVKLNTSVITYVDYSDDAYFAEDIKMAEKGFGTSIKLPNGGNNIAISQTYNTTLGGTIYASYQHAMTNVSLKSSQNYDINYAGYGHVFDFPYSVGQNYDCMDGVSIKV